MTQQPNHTERNEAAYAEIDTWDDGRVLDALAEGQDRAIAAVRAALPEIARAAEVIANKLRAGGKLYYAGAGTSIRIGVQDGSELPATFGLAETQLGYLIAGGREAIFHTLADAEDDAAEGACAAKICTAPDVVIAIAASGTTPYTVGAARCAKQNGAFLISIVNNPDTVLGALGEIEIILRSGPEVIAGSTRMGAGTAQKVALNFISTLANMKLGAVHDGMMVNVNAGNAKLRTRAIRIVMRIAGATERQATAALDEAKGQVKPAILICRGVKSLPEARQILLQAGENLRLALSRISAP